MDVQPAISPYRSNWIKSLHRQFEPLAYSYGRPAFLIFISAWLIYNATHTIQRIIDFYNPLPMRDYWQIVLKLNAYRSFHWGVLWVPHNEHRIVFPELIFASDMLLWHGRLILPLIVSFLCYSATWITLSSTVLADDQLPAFQRSVAFMLAGIIVLWKGAVDVLAAPFLLQWTLMQFAAACSFVFLSRIRKSRSNLSLLGVIAAATVATYSSGNALVLWPLIIFLAFLLRLNKTQLITFASSAVANLALYFVDYHVSSTLNLRNFVSHPFSSLGFVASYLSMPFGGMKTPAFGVMVGLFSLVGTAALSLVAVRKRLHFLPPAIVLLSYYVFTLLTALMTAAGRMDPADSQFGGAKALRYITVPQMNWGVFVLFCLWVVWRARWSKQIGNLIAVGFMIWLALYLPKLKSWLDSDADFFAGGQMATLSVENGLRDKDLLTDIYPDPSLTSAGLLSLQQAKLSIYSYSRSSWLGKPVHLFAPIRNLMPGAITEIAPVESGLQVTGWADTSQWKSPYRWIMLTDASGKIVGLGSRIPAGFPVTARSLNTPAPLGWVGFIPDKLQPAAVSAYVVDPRKKNLFPLAVSKTTPPFKIVSPADLGSPIHSIQWKADIPGASSLVPLHIDSTMISAPIQSSWAGSDANVGAIASSVFSAPGNGCMILPVLHGPVGDQVSIVVRDIETGTAVIDQTLHRNDNQHWKFWRVQLRPAAKISIMARDEGNGWGEWVAVSSPYTCR